MYTSFWWKRICSFPKRTLVLSRTVDVLSLAIRRLINKTVKLLFWLTRMPGLPCSPISPGLPWRNKIPPSVHQVEMSLTIVCCLTRGLGGGYSTKFYTGRLRPQVQPFNILYIISDRKAGCYFGLPFFDEWYPFHIPSLELCPFL